MAKNSKHFFICFLEICNSYHYFQCLWFQVFPVFSQEFWTLILFELFLYRVRNKDLAPIFYAWLFNSPAPCAPEALCSNICLAPLVKNPVIAVAWVCVLYSIPLVHVSISAAEPCCFSYGGLCSVFPNQKLWCPPALLFILRIAFAVLDLLYRYINFSIAFL